MTYCRREDAELIVLPIRYKNPTHKYTPTEENTGAYEYWWDDDVLPFLKWKPIKLNSNLVIRADVKIQATSPTPLTSLYSINGASSAVYGHSQVAMQCVPTPRKKLPNVLFSTGSVSQKNYSDTKLGRIAEFHHTNAALVVEIQDKTIFHARQLVGDSQGGFYDITGYYCGRKKTKLGRVPGLIMGDSHVYNISPAVVEATFGGKDSICGVLRPEKLIWHDLLDFYTGSHHHERFPYLEYQKAKFKRDDVFDELLQTVKFAVSHTPKGTQSLIVPSNHDQHLDRWLQRPLANNRNARIYHFLNHLIYEYIDQHNEIPSALRVFADAFVPDHSLEFLDAGKGYKLKGIEVAQHGEYGANGGRGSINAYAKSAHKHVIGHYHSPGIRQGTTQVGTSTGELDYIRGLGGWLNSHAVVYPNGKRSLINIIEGQWRV